MNLRDEEIQKNVLDEFKWDGRINPTEIGVTVKDGVVSLVGKIDSYWRKWNAEEIALRVRGVKAVANELEVELPSKDVRSDEEIARAAKEKLEAAWDVPDTVTVSVERGWVTLRGRVQFNHQREAAARIVRDLVGVKGVTNLITIEPQAKPEDVKRRIESALIRAAEIDAENIQVDVQDGRVVLKGRVHSWYEKEAKREAWLAPGIREVVDQLEISF